MRKTRLLCLVMALIMALMLLPTGALAATWVVSSVSTATLPSTVPATATSAEIISMLPTSGTVTCTASGTASNSFFTAGITWTLDNYVVNPTGSYTLKATGVIAYNASFTNTNNVKASASITVSAPSGADAAAVPPAPYISAAASNGAIVVSWGAVASAYGYNVYRATAGTGFTHIGSTTSSSYTDSTARIGESYMYVVYAYNVKGTGPSSNAATAKTELGQVYSVTATPGSGSIYITWNSVSGVTGYKVYRTASGGSPQHIASVSGTSYSDSGVVGGISYSYSIMPYASVATGEVYGKAGGSQYVSLRPGVASLSVKKSGSNGITVSWKNVQGASGYALSMTGKATQSVNLTAGESKASGSYTHSYTFTGLEYGTYAFTVQTLVSGTYGDASAPATYSLSSLDDANTITMRASGRTAIKISWRRVVGATAYNVKLVYPNGAEGVVTVASNGKKTQSVTIKKLVRGTYAASVQAITATESGNWIDCEKTLNLNPLKRTSSIRAKLYEQLYILVSWKKVSGATGYRLHYSSPSGNSFIDVPGGDSDYYLFKFNSLGKHVFQVQAFDAYSWGTMSRSRSITIK